MPYSGLSAVGRSRSECRGVHSPHKSQYHRLHLVLVKSFANVQKRKKVRGVEMNGGVGGEEDVAVRGEVAVIVRFGCSTIQS